MSDPLATMAAFDRDPSHQALAAAAEHVAELTWPTLPPMDRSTGPGFARGVHALRAGTRPLRRHWAVRAALIADWACYPDPGHRVSEPRLASVIAAYPAGFRIEFANHRGHWYPVGYTGFFPITDAQFDRLLTTPGSLRHRDAIEPAPNAAASPPLYLFNYSIIASLRGTPASGAMLAALAQAVATTAHRGLVAAVVSEAGARVARGLGMSELTGVGATEDALFSRQTPLVRPCPRP